MASFKPISKRDRQLLIDHFSGIPGYLDGLCFFFAIAVSRGTGAQLVLLEEQGKVLHAGVRRGSQFRDLRGDMDEEVFVARYTKGTQYTIRDTSEVELVRISKESGAFVSEEGILITMRRAESVWPEWEWKESKLKQVLAFTEELEALCEKYGTSLREMYPATPPVICERDGSEGFQIEHFPNPTNQFLLRRIIK